MGFFKRLTSGSNSTKPASASSSSARTASTSPAPAFTLDKRGEDALRALGKYDTVFLVDDSGSMKGVWESQLAPALSAVVKTAAQYDDTPENVPSHAAAGYKPAINQSLSLAPDFPLYSAFLHNP